MLSNFIDAHIHINQYNSVLPEIANEHHVSLLSINTDIPFFPKLEIQEDIILQFQKSFSNVHFIASFPMSDWHQEDWAEKSKSRIVQSMRNGAKGVKLWKNIGMNPLLKNVSGKFLMIDHEILSPVFKYMEEKSIKLVGHQGEPRNCWLPLDQMTMNSDRNYFAQHPEYHMYLHPEYPTYNEQMEARDHMLDKYPMLAYVGLHLFSMEWSLIEVDKRLDKYPNTMTDLAERICHVQYQSKKNRASVIEFFTKHQDRIIYGTDVIDDGSVSSDAIKERILHLWQYHYEYFATDATMQAEEFDGSFRGLNLDTKIIEKIFLLNAMKTYNIPYPKK
ncbi:MAG: amidohydrolase family protein [Saprospiraceae bacterium]|nr:amidohydrolase family protein [Saprospiraceae bacterium]